jgi:hypothetical protein
MEKETKDWNYSRRWPGFRRQIMSRGRLLSSILRYPGEDDEEVEVFETADCLRLAASGGRNASAQLCRHGERDKIVRVLACIGE